MNLVQADRWERMLARRQRRRFASKADSHSLAHVDPDRCYEWLRSDCAALTLARQSREDGLIGTITQISSTALLGIPGLLLASDSRLPAIRENPLLFAGVGLFAAALLCAMLEQYLSGKAYARQVKVTSDFYLMLSETREDTSYVEWLRLCRKCAYITFVVALVASTVALFSFREKPNGQTSKPATATTSPANSVAQAKADTSAGQPWHVQVGPRLGTPTSTSPTVTRYIQPLSLGTR